MWLFPPAVFTDRNTREAIMKIKKSVRASTRKALPCTWIVY